MKTPKILLATTVFVVLAVSFMPLGAATTTSRPMVWAKYCQAISGAYTDSEALTYGTPLSQVRAFAVAQTRDASQLIDASKFAPSRFVGELTKEWANAVEVSVRQKGRIIALLTGTHPTSAVHVSALRAAYTTLGMDQRMLIKASLALPKSDAAICSTYSAFADQANQIAVAAFMQAEHSAHGATLNANQYVAMVVKQYGIAAAKVGASWTMSFRGSRGAHYGVCTTIAMGSPLRTTVVDGACS